MLYIFMIYFLITTREVEKYTDLWKIGVHEKEREQCAKWVFEWENVAL